MSSNVVIRKNGGFYSVYGKDCYILYYLFNYKIIDDRVGFPISSYNKVINSLNDNHISYSVTINNIEVNYKKKNNYDKFYELGKKKYDLNYRITTILEKINSLNEKEIDELLNLIETKI